MKLRNTALRILAIPLVALFLAACASSGEMEMANPDQSLIRVDNDVATTNEITVSIRDMAGTTKTLGTVERGTAENFVINVPELRDEVQLVAVVATAEDIVSERFGTEGGVTVNWFLPENDLEVQSDTETR